MNLHLPQNTAARPAEANHLLEEFSREAKSPTVEPMSLSYRITAAYRIRKLSWPICYRYYKQGLSFLLPTFIQNRLRPEPATLQSLHPTAYLDGIRGLAAFLVFFYHFYYTCHDGFQAYGANGQNWEIVKLPIIRFFYNGTAMVCIFFVVSGYALSLKPVKLMRGKRWNELLHCLSSTAFRRAIRLLLPCFASTLMIVLMARLGAYEATRRIAEDPHRLTGHRENHIRRYNTLDEQLYDWGREMWKVINPFTFITYPGDIHMDGHLWTIPAELRSSLILSITQLVACRVRSIFRVLLLVLLFIWCLISDRIELIPFYGGFLLAELDLRRSMPAKLPHATTSTSPSRRSYLCACTYICSFFVSIYLCSQPLHAEKAPGWQTLYKLIPSTIDRNHAYLYWNSWGAILLVWAVSISHTLQLIFINGFAQYLGRISFSMYLVHNLTIHTVGYKSLELLWIRTGYKTTLGKETGFCIALVMTTTFTIWLADLFMRVVDIPSIKFARWLENKCIVQLERHD